ncbi:Nucleoid-associated protein YgaU, contains BON and LysM domains [Lysobacter enzymogenes]|nr:Nucleoid-associated protein YgaU, contains BON and LysM domains [Lysobacter enzymogenes]
MRRTWWLGAAALMGLAGGWWGLSGGSYRIAGFGSGSASSALPATADASGAAQAAAKAARAHDGFRAVPASLPQRAGAGFANAPDRGDLVAYPARPQILHDGAYTWHRAGLSERHALAAIASGRLRVTTPSGETLSFRYQRTVEHDSGDWTWVGRVDGEAGKQAILTFGERAVFGVIDQPGKPALKLTMRDGASWLVETDPVRLALTGQEATVHADDFKIPEPSAAAAPAYWGASAAAALPVAADAADAATATIDVLIGYSKGYATGLGGASQAVTRLNNLVDITNQAYANSQIAARLRLVSTLQVDYTDSGDNGDALDALSGVNGAAVDPAFNALRAARDQYGADLVSFVRKYDRSTHNGCGVAWIIGGGQQAYTARSAGSGYSVVSDGRESVGGTTYFCREETFAHELGHNLGAQHDRATASSDGTLRYGAFAYSFGYKTTANSGNFYDIMAYGDSGQTAYRVFSNPRITFCGGLACGVENQADLTRTFNQTAPIAATFRATLRVGVRNDFDGDGRSDIYWRNAVNGVNDLWQMSGIDRKAVSTVYREPDTSWKVLGSGDFDGDGLADVLWRNAVGGEIYIQLMNGDRIGKGGYSTTVADQNWQVVALGDFDGDGRTDLYWRNKVTGYNDVWLMDGIARKAVATVYREADMNWTVVGAGDFNGDGRADLFWRNRANGQNYVQFMSGTSVLAGSGQTTAVPDLPFQVVAIGDFNGDGRSDLYWRNKVTGECYVWIMNGTSATGITRVHVETDQAWQVVSSGDYNGDGRTDVFWRNSRNGQNYIQLMSGTSILPGSGSVYTVADQSWQVVGSGAGI